MPAASDRFRFRELALPGVENLDCS